MDGQHTILLVEDQEIIALDTAMQLEAHGYRVIHARDASGARTAALGTEAISVILMDIELGRGVDGIKVAQEILAEREIPVIFLSAHTDEGTTTRAGEISSYGFVVKDSGFAVLLASIRTALKLHEANQTIRQQNTELEKYALYWKTTFDSVSDAVAILDREQHIVQCNTAMSRMFDMPEHAITGKHCWEVVHGSDSKVGTCPGAKSLITGKHESEELREAGKWFEITVDPIFAADGTVHGAVHVIRDITERKNTEIALQESEHRFQLFMDNFPGLAYIKDFGHTTLYANSAFKTLLGLDPAQLIGRPEAEFFPDEFARQMAAFDRSVMESGKPTSTVEFFAGKTWYSHKFPMSGPEGMHMLGGLTLDITEQKKTEDALAESEKRFRTLFEKSMDGNLIIANGTFIDCNDAVLDLMRCKKEDVIGKTPAAISPERQPDGLYSTVKADQLIAQTLRDGRSSFEWLHVRPDGTEFWADISLTAITISNDTIIHCTWRDITARKRIELELVNTKAILDAAIAQSPVPMVLAGYPDGQFHYVNQACLDALGYTAGNNPVGNTLTSFEKTWQDYDLDGNPIPITELPLSRALRGESVRMQPMRIHTLTSDQDRWIMASATPIYGEDGVPIAAFLIFTDITDLHIAIDSLRESEARFRTIVTNTPLVTFSINAEGIFTLSEGKGLERLGLLPGQVVGIDACEYYRDYPIICDGIHRALAGEEVRVELDIGGTWFDAIFTPQFDSRGKVSGLLGVAFDISERKQAEEERLNLERRILQTQKLESLGVLAGGIAHDFNNILMAVLGHADLALSELSPLSPATENLKEIEKAAKRAAELARQMLAYSGRGKFVIEELDINFLIDEMLHLLKSTIPKKIILNIDLSRGLPVTKGDPTQLRQILMNLVINASEAIGDASGVIRIATSAGAPDPSEGYIEGEPSAETYVILEITDTGCGMTEDTRSRIFEPFFTTKFTGRGLGMSAVLGIVKSHNGMLTLRSEPGKGSTFKIYFPALSNAQTAINKAPDPTTEEWSGSGTILLVDDEETIRTLTAQMLERIGFAVVTAADGNEAIERYEASPGAFRAVLLDLTMPRMSGEETFRELRLLDPRSVIIISSGYTETDISGRFTGQGISGFIQKPYTVRNLRAALKTVLSR